MTAKQLRFIEEYLVDLNATQAAIRAGYSEKTAEMIGWENLRKPEIGAAIRAAQAKTREKTEITEAWILEKLAANLARAEEDREGNVVNKACELLGKHIGMFPDRHEHSGRIDHEHSLTEFEAWATGLLERARARHVDGGVQNGQAPALGAPTRTTNGSLSLPGQ